MSATRPDTSVRGVDTDVDTVSEVHDANTLRTLSVLAALTLTAPVDAAVTALAALVIRPVRPAQPERRRTVLVTGGKMTKALALARAFHAAGHRVVLVESPRYRWTGHRFSRAVDTFRCVPDVGDPAYPTAIREIVEREGVDVVVPVSSPAASHHDAVAGALLASNCEILHGDVDTVDMLDDKASFSAAARRIGLAVPDFARITDPRQIEEFDFRPGRTYILKRIAYNPVGRLDLTPLAADTPEHNVAVAQGLSILPDDPWILQEFVDGQEYCTHSTVRDGRVQVYGCCTSSATQVNYAMVDHPEIRRWVETFVSAYSLTGQVSFDFIESSDGHVYAIECNPRTHSAITMFYNHPGLAAAYLNDGHDAITPLPSARPTHWLYHELWRLISKPRRYERMRTIRSGTDAVFSWSDPLPYLALHHLQIPILLVDNLRRRRGWTRIDFNIGKLVENGGD